MILRRASSRRVRGALGRRTAAGIALASLILASCATPPPMREIDASADGASVTLVPGQALSVTVDANPYTGYRWVVDRGAAAVLQPVGEPLYRPVSTSAPLVGAGGTTTFNFVAHAAGMDTLQLVYRRPSPQDSAAARSLRVEIVVQ
jgi:inhibitor of cysteine peptidase